MKKLIWKLRYTFRLRKLLRLSWVMCWQSAGSALESSHGDTSECPIEAAEYERDEWAACAD